MFIKNIFKKIVNKLYSFLLRNNSLFNQLKIFLNKYPRIKLQLKKAIYLSNQVEENIIVNSTLSDVVEKLPKNNFSGVDNISPLEKWVRNNNIKS